jgi:hypothetical protein
MASMIRATYRVWKEKTAGNGGFLDLVTPREMVCHEASLGKTDEMRDAGPTNRRRRIEIR